jgi:hypothetical protein
VVMMASLAYLAQTLQVRSTAPLLTLNTTIGLTNAAAAVLLLHVALPQRAGRYLFVTGKQLLSCQ